MAAMMTSLPVDFRVLAARPATGSRGRPSRSLGLICSAKSTPLALDTPKKLWETGNTEWWVFELLVRRRHRGRRIAAAAWDPNPEGTAFGR